MHPVAALFSIRPLGGEKKPFPAGKNGSGGLMGPAAVTSTKGACRGGEKRCAAKAKGRTGAGTPVVGSAEWMKRCGWRERSAGEGRGGSMTPAPRRGRRH